MFCYYVCKQFSIVINTLRLRLLSVYELVLTVVVLWFSSLRSVRSYALWGNSLPHCLGVLTFWVICTFLITVNFGHWARVVVGVRADWFRITFLYYNCWILNKRCEGVMYGTFAALIQVKLVRFTCIGVSAGRLNDCYSQTVCKQAEFVQWGSKKGAK